MSFQKIDPWLSPQPTQWQPHVRLALEEDIGPGDATSLCLPDDLECTWQIECQEEGVLCGAGIIEYLLDPANEPFSHSMAIRIKDGSPIKPGSIIAEGQGQARRMLTLERTVLNYLMHLSGVATLTSKFVSAVSGTSAQILDTRKTTPGMRNLEKYAVRCGGGINLRIGLFDGILIKDNHIGAAGSIQNAISEVRKYGHHLLKVEVECENEDQVHEAIHGGAEIILLDNMSPARMKKIVELHRGKAFFEASGSITLDNVAAAAKSGVDFISSGALTHSAPALAIHMEVNMDR